MVDRKSIPTETAVARIREMEKGIVKGSLRFSINHLHIYIGATGEDIMKKWCIDFNEIW